MKRQTAIFCILTALFTLFSSVPFLVPHTGPLMLIAFVPLLCMERMASLSGRRHFWFWHYACFVLWNACTTFWVCNATVGGGIFAVLANALQMSLVFGLFRWAKRRMKGVLPYIFLAAAWIAWEKYYLTVAQISWPWLILGNAFAGTVGLAQWYDTLGSLGGSLWVWASNLAVFGLMTALSDGAFARWKGKARAAALISSVLVFFWPMVWSAVKWHTYRESREPLDVVLVQPNFDPYHKFVSMTQEQQTALMAGQIESALSEHQGQDPVLVLTPETSTNDVVVGAVQDGMTYNRFLSLTRARPWTNILFGASSHEYIFGEARPSPTAWKLRDGVWIESHNSALIVDSTGRYDLFHKSKLVIGTEMLPYPKVLGPVNDWLGHPSATSTGQKEIDVLHFRPYRGGEMLSDVPVGCAVCYESVYGEYCTGYVRKGARLIAVITNDAWWGNTPGYRQHLNYSRLRAIETRRDIARSANTGISAIIDQRGRILEKTDWWVPATLSGTVHLNDAITPFVAYGDIVGRLCVFIFLLLLLSAFLPSRSG